MEFENFDYDQHRTALSCKNDQSDKFWFVDYIDDYYYVHFGKNGTMGTISIKQSEDENIQKFIDKTIRSKLSKGYKKTAPPKYDAFEAHKANCKPVLQSIHCVFYDEIPIIYIAALKSACDKFCDLLRLTDRDEKSIRNTVKSFVLCVNKLNEETDIIETDEREMLYDFIVGGAKLAGLSCDEEDITEEWREW